MTSVNYQHFASVIIPSSTTVKFTIKCNSVNFIQVFLLTSFFSLTMDGEKSNAHFGKLGSKFSELGGRPKCKGNHSGLSALEYD